MPPPLNPADLLKAAVAHHQAGRLQQAEQLYRQILQQQPQHVEAMSLLGVIACQYDKLPEGIALYQQALAIKPEYLPARENLNLALWKYGRAMTEQALAGFNQITSIHPEHIQSFLRLGQFSREQGNLEPALAYFQQALAIDPTNLEALQGVGVVLLEQGKPKTAALYHQRMLALQPNHLEAQVSLAKALSDQGYLAEARQILETVLAQQPNYPVARYNYGLLQLQLGEFAQGFIDYEYRLQTPDFPPCPFTQPMWDGSDLNGRTLLLHAEQGLGDTIQFIRYAAIASQRHGRVILTCQAPLIRLLSQLPYIEDIIPFGIPAPHFDVYAPLLSLPRILKTTETTVPNLVPYLQPVDSGLVLPVRDGTLKVGIVWSGGNLYKNNQARSTSLKTFEPLVQQPDLALYSLQKGVPQMDIVELGWGDRLCDLSDQLHDLADTAAAIAQLDLVISVDTSVAHLAGALAKPVWLLLPYLADWRWMCDRSDTPWYSTMRLFRQTQPGDWASVMQQITEALRQPERVR
jgi:tetratricopeptide (TPR) repeat protein